MFKFILFQLFIIFSFGATGAEFTIDSLPVQDGGRLKPFNTLSREMLTLTYGRSKFEDQEGRKHKATQIVATWMMVPEVWQKKAFIRIDHLGLKKALAVENVSKKFFTPEELFSNSRLDVVFRQLQTKVEVKEKLNPFYQAVQKLQNQLMSFHAIGSGSLRVAPNPDKESSTWLSVAELSPELGESYFRVLKSFAATFTESKGGSEKDLQVAINEFVEKAKANNPEAYPEQKVMAVEVHYNKLAPFMWSWILYALATVLIFLAILFENRSLRIAAWTSLAIAFAFHTYGFGLRVYLTGRPPVSNMYESVIWVGWGTVLFTAIFSFIKRRANILLAGAGVATLCMIVADRAPAILDASLQPLEPVLRSNLWLIVHVMTITLSYAAFFLALGISNVGMFHMIKGKSVNSEVIRDLVDSCYKCLQVGVVLLAAGTILGGVWADYSWGRFWGWDPKETWALIALLGYLALLHGRLAGWVKNFGMLAGSIIAFNLVIMAWYGVNFVLGAGLHSYGFGAGGIEYVAVFCGLQFLYVFYTAFYVKSLN